MVSTYSLIWQLVILKFYGFRLGLVPGSKVAFFCIEDDCLSHLTRCKICHYYNVLLWVLRYMLCVMWVCIRLYVYNCMVNHWVLMYNALYILYKGALYHMIVQCVALGQLWYVCVNLLWSFIWPSALLCR